MRAIKRQYQEERIPLSFSLIKDRNEKAYKYIKDQCGSGNEKLHILSTTTRFNVESLNGGKVNNLINIKRVNDARRINKFFETVNDKLESGGIYIGCFEDKMQRRDRIIKKHWFATPFLWIDFIWKRVMPKLLLTKKMYFGLTRGYNRVLSTPEVLGRLISCGFRIIDYRVIDGNTWFTVKKILPPVFDLSPTYGALVKLRRVGLNGKRVNVYKFRTMHPYSEYLQEYIYLQNDLKEGGKFKDDFRITPWGNIFRKLWIDELPMLYNWVKRELKVVGVRPLSEHYFDLYPEEYQNRRIKYKPGLVPPFYVDLPVTLDEIIASEIKYLDQYDKHPFLTDFKYFFKASYNIWIKKARSK